MSATEANDFNYGSWAAENYMLPIKLAGTFYPGQMGIPDPVGHNPLPHCEYCGRRQAKKDEPLCPGCGNVV